MSCFVDPLLPPLPLPSSLRGCPFHQPTRLSTSHTPAPQIPHSDSPMGRKKQTFTDDMDSSDEDGGNLESFEITDQDLEEEAEGFNDRRKRRKFTKEGAMLGIWGDDDDDDSTRNRRSKGNGYKDVRFVNATSTAKRGKARASDKDEDDSENMEEEDGDNMEKDDGEDREDGVDAPERRKPDGDDDFVDEYKTSGEDSSDEEARPRVPRRPIAEDEEDEPATRIGLAEGMSRGGLGAGLGFGLGFPQPGAMMDTDNHSSPSPSRPSLAPITPAKSFPRLSSPANAASPARSDTSLEDMASMQFGSTKRSGSRSSGTFRPGGDKVQQLRGQQQLPQRSREASPAAPPVDKNYARFNEYTKGFGMKMLEKMGWQTGQGLGSDGSGIINPVETKQRPQKMGLAFNNFKERTQQSRSEALRRGEVAVMEEVQQEEQRAKQKKEKRDAWRKDDGGKGGARKSRTTYKTAEEVMREASGSAGAAAAPAVAAQKIIDMTGPQARELQSMAQARVPTPTQAETTSRLPELRHNLHLLVDMAQSDLEHLTRERRISEVREQEAERERERLVARCTEDERRVRRLEEVRAIARELEARMREAVKTGFEAVDVTVLYGEWFDRLERGYVEEVDEYGLDALVVAVWAPVMKATVVGWEVLKEPGFGAEGLRRWRRLLKTGSEEEGKLEGGYMDVDEGGLNLGRKNEKATKKRGELAMTPYESMIYTLWLPKIRSAVNNAWSCRDCDPLITLLEIWQPPLLPIFIHENIVNQLILPKLTKEVTDWDPRKDPVMVHTWLHPWLPVLGADRLSPLFAIVRQKLTVALRQWHPSDASAIRIVDPWRDVFTPTEMETLIVKSVLPKLASALRSEFVVNARAQQMEPLQWVMAWRDLLSPVLMGQLLEQELFVKWAQALHAWLVSSPNFDEVAQWYSWWKSVFEGYGVVQGNVIVQACLRRGLDMMNQAMAGIKVPPPAPPSISSTSLASSTAIGSPGKQGRPVNSFAAAASAFMDPAPKQSVPSVTFKDLLEEFAQKNNLLFLPTAKVHEVSGKPLFRLGGSVSGVLVYVDNAEDLVFVQEEGAKWVPVDFEGLLEVLRKKEKGRG